MKKITTKCMVAVIAIMLLITSAIPVFAAGEFLSNDQKVSFTASCSKPGYTFNLYKVGTLTSTSNANANASPYRTGYNSLVTGVSAEQIEAAMSAGYTEGNSSTTEISALLAALDEMSTSSLASYEVSGTQWTSSDSVTSHNYSNLAQGVYYLRATNYPTGVTSVRNSVFALPYYGENGWTYTMDDIPLAEKVADHPMETYKTITNTTVTEQQIPASNATKKLADSMHGVYQPATDVSLGDYVEFEIRSTITGSNEMKLNSYIVSDSMSKGLTLDKASIKMYLLDENGTKISELSRGADGTDYKASSATSDFVVTYGATNNGGGRGTDFKIALTRTFLHKDNEATHFYNSGTGVNAKYTSITYRAMLNEFAVVGTAGNPNTEDQIEWSNKNDVVDTYRGNTVYVYTWTVVPNKVKDGAQATPLAGADFKLFRTEADAQNLRNAIATGTSASDGKVTFRTASFNNFTSSTTYPITLERGTYYAVETKAPAGYQTYGHIIKLNVGVEYGNEFRNATWVKTAPEDGTLTVTVKNSPIETPNTGGFGDYAAYYLAAGLGVAGLLILGIVFYKKKSSRKIK